MAEPHFFQLRAGNAHRLFATHLFHRYQGFADILQYRQMREEIKLLKHHPHALANIAQLFFAIAPLTAAVDFTEGNAVQFYGASAGYFHKVQTAQQGALTRAAAANDGDFLTGIDI